MAFKSEPQESRSSRLMAMGQMAASLAHEIRNPLGSMELFCTLLIKDLKDQPQPLALASQIHQGIRTLDRIISNCLQFTRDVVPRKEWVDAPGQLLRECIRDVQPDAGGSAVTLRLVERGSAAVDIDPFLFRQVVVNLVTNAVEAAAERAEGPLHEPPLVVVTSTPRSGGGWTISVTDNGQGIGAEDLTHVFDPFFTTKKGGTGLGLPIVHSIVRAHGGTVSVASEPGAGCEVTVELPDTKPARGADFGSALHGESTFCTE